MWNGKRVLLGISGGIAAYKGPALVRALTAQGAEVRVVLTRAAAHFVSPLSLQAVSGHAVGQDLFDPAYEAQIGHIELARWPDAILVAPTTADLLAKTRLGLCDDLLTTILCATTAPILLAPAMNTQMWLHPATQEHAAALRQRPGVHLIAPDQGQLACKEVGPGRLPDPPALLDALARLWAPPLLLGRRALVTAGPTREYIDPVRFLSNPSTGKMGFAIARAAARLGAQVTLVAGPVHLETPPGVHRVDVTSAHDMYEAVFAALRGPSPPEVIVKAAAVADWRPANPSDQKTKKTPGDWHIPMTRTQDILASLGALPDDQRPVLVGFAAETNDIAAYALDKLHRKRLDMIVANSVAAAHSAFGADDNRVSFFDRLGQHEDFGPAPKDEVAERLWRRLLDLHLLPPQPTV
jgi:phosphopantothenoylcysteine decarboxylase/phosphopantothenate--cysteine ligase